ncbi:MAG: membrane-bound O-acyltransferase family protein [Planctomycetota bacterium]|nr:MAG: membrane-bound O-acyltransferase family protein [Planctomycetota bacterium]
MVFSTPLFLFLFLPIALSCYYLLDRRFRNGWLLLTSLFFYAWGETWVVGVMLLSCLTNYGLALWLESVSNPLGKRAIVGLSVFFNLALLITFKYANFLVDNLNPVLTWSGLGPIQIDPISLPIGISFFTFQALSYVIDVYRRDAPAQRSPIDFSLYIALFPQLIAGPIVRYHDVAAQIVQRVHSSSKFYEGMQRFIFGLTKKMLIANTAAECADAIYALPLSDLTPGLAWLGTICYTLQIYFDFSGYSDMAIGLGLMFGFRYLENFRHPYIAQSITDFWRRWHISLSSWFRDYLYIPLGGNRRGPYRTYFNLLLVFVLCGFWHGAAWTFLAWGVFHGCFLILERLGLGKALARSPAVARHGYTLLTVMAGWVLFRSESFEQALAMLAASIGFASGAGIIHSVSVYLSNELAVVLAAGVIFSTPIVPWIQHKTAAFLNGRSPSWVRLVAEFLAQPLLLGLLLALLILCSSKMAVGTYNPFIYFRF